MVVRWQGMPVVKKDSKQNKGRALEQFQEHVWTDNIGMEHDWRTEGMRPRGLQYILKGDLALFRQYVDVYFEAVAYCYDAWWQHYKQLPHKDQKKTYGSTKIRDFLKKVPGLIDYMISLGFPYSSQREAILEFVGERFNAYQERFTDKVITTKQKIDSSGGFRLGMNDVWFEGSKVFIRSHLPNPNATGKHNEERTLVMEFDTEVPDAFQYMLELRADKGFRCNIRAPKKKKPVLVQQVKVPTPWKYKPVGAMGIDINKKPETYLAFSQKIWYNGEWTHYLPRTSEIDRVVNEINEINNKLNEKQGKLRVINGRERKRLKKRRKYLQKTGMTNAVMPIVDLIIKIATQFQRAVCVDLASVGAKNGEYGQKIIGVLITECQNRGIPHILVPTYFTTQRCVECGWRTPTPTTEREFVCANEECANVAPRDLQSSFNIESYGWKIWCEGFKKFTSWRKRAGELVLEYESNAHVF